jgi:nitroimidazol reductase NimA-like FMN-containing flavoprotein (pyridoxamine 5'-phosphate oxidase superfamily)
MAETVAITARTRMRRKAKRACYDRDTLYAILDEALIASVAVVDDGRPRVQPMIHARIGDEIVLHGHAGNHLLSLLADGAEACLNISLVDGLVLARTIADHSLHYRSVTLFGRAANVEDPAEKLALMEKVFASLVRSGRYATLPPLDPQYLKGTRVLRMPIEEAVGKVNDEHSSPDDGPAGLWSGLIPLSLHAGDPRPDDRTRLEQVEPDASIAAYDRTRAAG